MGIAMVQACGGAVVYCLWKHHEHADAERQKIVVVFVQMFVSKNKRSCAVWCQPIFFIDYLDLVQLVISA